MMKLMGFSKFDTTKVWFSVGFGTVGIMMMMILNDNFAGNSNQMESWNEDNVNEKYGFQVMASVLALLCSANGVYGLL